MGFTALVTLLGTVLHVILKGIPFVEGLLEKGSDKKAAVMGLAETVANSATDQIIANNPNWVFIKPMADKFIEDVLTAVNAAKAAQQQK